MSSHSRSSSELYTMCYYDTLQVFFEAFKSDFDFDDIEHLVKQLFSKIEIQLIKSEQDDERRLLQLFAILQSKDSIIPQFLKNIEEYYGFLTEPIKNEYNNPSKATSQYLDKVNMVRSCHPKHTDYNVLRMDTYIALRNALRKLKRYHNVVLFGDFGTGKKWLALSACYDYTLLKAMDFQIYWLDVSDCMSPEQDLNRLQTLLLMLGGSSLSPSPTFSNGTTNGFVPTYNHNNESIFNRKLELQQILRNKLSSPEHQNCLVILKDVKNFKTYETFNLGCKMLLITRYKKVFDSLSPKMSKLVTITNGLTVSEFYTLFEKYLKRTRDTFPKNAIDIYDHSKGHPYLLSLIAQNLYQKRNGWDVWISTLKNFHIPNKKFSKAVEMSLNVLSEEMLNLYATMVIFPEAVPIPVGLLSALWNKSQPETEEIVKHFDEHSFLIIEKSNFEEYHNDSYCTLPFIYRTHLLSMENMREPIYSTKELHTKVIEYYKMKNDVKVIDLCARKHDIYFFSCIGYHLDGAGLNDLFPILYKDFGFLEQKMRAVGLSNTIRDLKFFEDKIINNDQRTRNLLNELIEFLPKIEEKLTESKNTSLLQYALMGTGSVYEEAKRQICQFPQRVWFNEHGYFHKRRQIVRLEYQAKCIRFLDQETCLVVLSGGNMLLLDISLDCPMPPILLQNDDSSKSSEITEARLFRDGNFILTLDVGGALKVWSIADDHGGKLVSRRCSRQKRNHLKDYTHSQLKSQRYKQRIQENFKGQHDTVVAFYIEQLPKEYNYDTYLHVAFKNGDVSVFKWNSNDNEFVAEKISVLPTKSYGIRFLTKILKTYYIIISNTGSIECWYLRDSSKVYVPSLYSAMNSCPLSYELYNSSERTCAVFVLYDKVLRITFEAKDFNDHLEFNIEVLYENLQNKNNKSDITCAKLSDDQRYLFLGTKQALIVYDVEVKSEVLRSNVSDPIACLDVYPLEDKIFKHLIICGSKGRRHILNILAIRTNGENGITWAHNVTSMGNEISNDPQLEPDVWLLGQKLYDIKYKEDGSTLVMAVDSKNRVHQVNTSETKSFALITPRETSESITSITIGGELAFVGYSNGEVFNITSGTLEILMEKSILYLKLFDDSHLIASTDKETVIYNVGAKRGLKKTFSFDTKHSYKISDKYILLVAKTGLFTVIQIRPDAYETSLKINGLRFFHLDTDTLSDCDYKNKLLCLATESSIRIYKIFIDSIGETLTYLVSSMSVNNFENFKNYISCTALAMDGSLLAVGTVKGDIKIYKVQEKSLEFYYHLESHRSCIYDLIFSPDNMVLVSCAEQLCFWNIPYVLNNPLIVHSAKRRSSRFSSQRSNDSEEVVDAKMVSHNNGALKEDNFLRLENFNEVLYSNGNGGICQESAWCDKLGPVDKPELYSCIKFDGSKAERVFASPDFTQFHTIDDEGVYYHLSLSDVPSESSETITTFEQVDEIDIKREVDINERINEISLGKDEVGI